MGIPIGSALELLQIGTPATPPAGANLLYVKSDGKVYTKTPAGVEVQLGDVAGPASSTSGNLPSFNGSTGKILQDSGIAASNVDTLSGAQTITGVKNFAATARPMQTQALGEKIDYNTATAYVGNHPMVHSWTDTLMFRAPTMTLGTDGVTFGTTETTPNAQLVTDGRGDTVYAWATTNPWMRLTFPSGNFISYLSTQYIQLNFAYQSIAQSLDIVVETSTDGVTWTSRASVTGISTADAMIWIRPTNWGGDTYLRVTLHNTTGTQTMNLNAVRLWSLRWWNQGGGNQSMLPYLWLGDKQMRAMNHWAPNSNNAYTLGNSSLRWSTVYGTNGDFSGALTSATSTLAGLVPTSSWKTSVKAASTVNVAIPPGGTTLAVDGVSMANGDRVLLKNQTNLAQNGIYVVGGVGSSVTLTRPGDGDASGDMAGATVSVDQGSQYGQIWTTIFSSTDTLGTTAMPWYRLLDTSTLIPKANLGSGTADATTYLRGDGTWQPVPSGITATNGTATLTANQNFTTTSDVDASGLTATLTAGTYMVVVNADTDVAAGQLILSLYVNGVADALTLRNQSTNRSSLARTWIVTTTASQVVKVMGRMGSANTGTLYSAGTSMVWVKIA